MSGYLRVTAHLDTATTGIVGQPFMLDGPLAWAEAVTGDYPPLTRDHAPEIPLPLVMWEEDGEWGWCTSRALYDVASHSALEVRRKPADAELSRFTRERKNHHALGPHKAKDAIIPTALIPKIWWDIECADEEWLRRLLDQITHLGGHRARGLGHVTQWETAPGEPGAWKDRPYNKPTRPPYWHPERRHP